MKQNQPIYLSYHNQDLALALQLGHDLLLDGFQLWLDRFVVKPLDSWSESILEVRSKADVVISLLSESYFLSEYSLGELDSFRQTEAFLLVLCLDQSSLEAALADERFDVVLDFTTVVEKSEYEPALQALKEELLIHGLFVLPISEEKAYVFGLLMTLELELSRSFTASLALRQRAGLVFGASYLRPRLHSPEAWLVHGQYGLFDVNNYLARSSQIVVSNVVEWLQWRSQMFLLGSDGSGKTTLLQYLCLSEVFRFLESGFSSPLPFYLDLQDWKDDQDISEFILAGWRMSSDVFELLRRGAVMLFVDAPNEFSDYEMGRLEQLRQFFDAEEFPAFVGAFQESVLSYFQLPDTLPLLYLAYLNEKQIALITESALLDSSVVQVSDVSTVESLVVSLLASSVESEAVGLEQFDYVLPALWTGLRFAHARQFTLLDMEVALESLAVAAIEFRQIVYFPRTLALRAMGNDLLIYLSEALGILKLRGDYLRFALPSVFLYLAAKRLLREGIYTILKQPSFDKAGQRLSQSWDAAVFFALRLVSPSDFPLLIQTIADVDPYLAFEASLLHLEVPAATNREIILKLIEVPDHPLRSLSLSKQVISRVYDKIFVVNLLCEVLRGKDVSRWETAFELLRDFDFPIAPEYVEVLAKVDRSFPDSFIGLSESFSDNLFLAYLFQLVLGADEAECLSAIFVLGETRLRIGLFLLTSLPMDMSVKILREAVLALSKIQDVYSLPFLYRLLLHPDKDLVSVVLLVMDGLEADLKVMLLEFLLSQGEVTEQFLKMLFSVSESALGQVLVYIFGNLGFAYSHSLDLENLSFGGGDMVRRLLDFLSSKMASLNNREGFQSFAEETLERINSGLSVSASETARRSQVAQRVHGLRSAPLSETDDSVASELPASLLRALQAEDWMLRFAALEQLAQYPAELSLDALLSLTKDADSQLRVAALAALPDPYEYPSVFAVMMEALHDPEYQVIDAVALRLRLMDERCVEALIVKLPLVSAYGQATIIEILGQKGSDVAVSSLIDFVDDLREPWMWNRCIGDIALEALLAIASPDALRFVQESGRIVYPSLGEILFPDTDDAVMTVFDQFRVLLADLHSDVWQVSQEASRQMREKARSLRGENNEALALWLAEYLVDANWMVRWTLVETLAWLQVSASLDALLPFLVDEHWMVRIAVIRALIELKAASAVPNLLPLLGDENSSVREMTAEALGELGDSRFIPDLARALTDVDQFVRLALVRAVIALNDVSQFFVLEKVLSDSYSHVRWYAVRALSEAPRPACLRAIVPLLKDYSKPSWEERSISNYVELALQRMGTEKSRQVLERWKQLKSVGK